MGEIFHSNNNTSRNLYESIKVGVLEDATPIVEESICALEALLDLDKWQPERTDWFYILQLISWGFPFTFFNKNNSIDSLRRDFGKEISRNGAPKPAKFSEINAVALLAALGASSVERIPETDSRTPDFKVGWEENYIELEVTRADQKQSHKDRYHLASQIARDLHGLGQPWDLIIHFTEILNQNEVIELIRIATSIKPGELVESVGRWRIIAATPAREVGVVHTYGQWYDNPSWWRNRLVESFTFAQYADTHGALQPNPQVCVYFGTPIESYINPVRNKADRVQGSGHLPFLIAIDISQLPKGLSEFRRELPKCFPMWQQVTAVLVFEAWCAIDKVGWTSELITNPYSTSPLPAPIFKSLRGNQGSVNSWANLTGQV